MSPLASVMIERCGRIGSPSRVGNELKLSIAVFAMAAIDPTAGMAAPAATTPASTAVPAKAAISVVRLLGPEAEAGDDVEFWVSDSGTDIRLQEYVLWFPRRLSVVHVRHY